MGKPHDALPRETTTTTTTTTTTAPSSSSDAGPVPRGRSAPPQSRYYDRDDDLPPLYTDHDDFNEDDSVFDPLLPWWRHSDDFETVHPFRQDDTTTYFLDPRLDRDPDFLASHIDKLATVPPRPFIRLVGTHRDKSSSNHPSSSSSSSSTDNRDSSTVVDFELDIELTHLLYSDIRHGHAWRRLHTAGNFEKVRRGTVCATRAPGFGGAGSLPEEGVPSLREWCRRYCASRSSLKCFTMQRRVEGYDWDLLRRRLEGLARATNYRGRLEIDFPVRHARVVVYNDCRANRWRLTRWIVTLFTFTLLFLLSWPWLHFGTKRWETVTAEWSMSEPTAVPGRKRYVSLSEEQWYSMWAGTIQKAMLERRRGTLDQGDLERTTSAQRPDGLVGVMQAGMEAMGVVNRSFGWGGDTC